MEELLYKLIYLTGKTNESYEELYLSSISGDKQDECMKNLYKAIMQEKMVFNSLNMSEIITLLEELSIHSELIMISDRCRQKLNERKCYLEGKKKGLITYRDYSMGELIDTVIDIKTHNLLGKRIDNFEGKLKEDLQEQYRYDTYCNPIRTTYHEMQGIYYGFENIPEYDFDWLIKKTGVDLDDVEDYLLDALIDTIMFLRRIKSSSPTEYDNIYDILREEAEASILISFLDGYHLEELAKYHYSEGLYLPDMIKEEIKVKVRELRLI